MKIFNFFLPRGEVRIDGEVIFSFFLIERWRIIHGNSSRPVAMPDYAKEKRRRRKKPISSPIGRELNEKLELAPVQLLFQRRVEFLPWKKKRRKMADLVTPLFGSKSSLVGRQL